MRVHTDVMFLLLTHCVLSLARVVYVVWLFRTRGAPVYLTLLFLIGAEGWAVGDLATHQHESLAPLIPPLVSCCWLRLWFRFVFGVGLVCVSQVLFFSELRSIVCHVRPLHTHSKQRITLLVMGSMYLCVLVETILHPQSCAPVSVGARVWLAVATFLLYASVCPSVLRCVTLLAGGLCGLSVRISAGLCYTRNSLVYCSFRWWQLCLRGRSVLPLVFLHLPHLWTWLGGWFLK